ncbi:MULTISPECIES: dephospho-CoA kinase [unclassified Selenomonas]|uniref:dephospho-CoA kinase n=1 Tax=unclassified Selenomonas TaxID=2637378 RepID=UPI00027819A8|nr:MULTISPECIES: dephospho-CoA kinase [unclassified Selenomonas]EJO22706.1 dephospho-CoA kinase [Selenomonas sp. FOBRC6]EKX96322.1 dephospho-CoA kinase [Selenomonas sp. oral taxon 138 str. F0429]
MKIIGLTGGIACGKSTVSRALRAHGAAIIDADALAHELSQPGQAIFNAYVERFGRGIVTAGGTLDRAAIAARVFADPTVRTEVDAITHPLIRAAAEERLRAARAAEKRAAVLDVPLLFEAGWDALADEVWVVALPAEEQLARLLARDKSMSEGEARARISAQMPLTEKCARADIVIDNSGTVEETRECIEQLWRERIIGRS